MARRGLLTAVAFVGALGASHAIDAQAGPSQRPREFSEPIDSAAVLGSARRAQAEFERVRRANLPRRRGITGQYCDETIGRYCFTDDDDTSEYALPEPLPTESPRVVSARAALLAELDSLSELLPGDDWIAGQHVRYLIEAGDLTAADQRAQRCAATRWWCDALIGMAHHAAWRYADADSAFTLALAQMPEAERCAWTDLRPLFADSLARDYARASCGEREALNARIWWLADPLYLRPGNDRRTEHYTRLTMDRLQPGAASGYATAWRWDLGVLLRRYGWPAYFSRALPEPMRNEPLQISAYHRSPSYHFLPEINPARGTLAQISEDRWRLRRRGARERYSPPYATFATLTQLTSLFRRGDSTIVVSAYDTRPDSMMPCGPLTAALVVSRAPDSTAATTVRHDAKPHGTLVVATTGASALASVEIIGGNRIDRARLPIAFADSSPRRIHLSDLALFTPGDSLPATLDAFLSMASASSTVERGARIGLFWEMYGLRESDAELVLRVQVVRNGRSWLRRAGERVGLVGRPGPVAFGWQEDPRTAAGVAARSIVVDLAGVDPGDYRIEVSLSGDGAPVTAARRIRIVP
jgi:hypothetical protein